MVTLTPWKPGDAKVPEHSGGMRALSKGLPFLVFRRGRKKAQASLSKGALRRITARFLEGWGSI